MGKEDYTPEFRDEAVDLLIAAGYPGTRGALTHTAKAVGISATSLTGWYRARVKEDADQRMEIASTHGRKLITDRTVGQGADLAYLRQLLIGNLVLVLEIIPSKLEMASAKEIVMLVGVLTDKLAMLEGRRMTQDRKDVIVNIKNVVAPWQQTDDDESETIDVTPD